MKIVHTNRNVLTLEIDDISAGWEQYFLLSSDHHWDSINCDRELMFEHLDLAKKRNAPVFMFGDFFSLMQGRYDPRRTYDNMRPEYKQDDYLGVICRDAIEQLSPYGDIISMMGKGNHDATVLKNCNIDIMSMLVGGLNRNENTNIQLGGYSGWIRFQFRVNKTKRMRMQLYYFHGSGGGGEVTRGVIRTNRIATYIENADVVAMGHTHDSWHVPIKRKTLSNKGTVISRLCDFINCGTYDDQYQDGADASWWVMSGKSPRPKGAVWLRFYFHKEQIRKELTIAAI